MREATYSPADTITLDLSSVTRRPLVPMLTAVGAVPHPDAHPDTDPFGASTNFWPWGCETSSALVDSSGEASGYVTTYVLPFEKASYFVGHSMGMFPEPIIRLISDPDTGPAAARLFARHLKTFWMTLMAGTQGMPGGFGLVKVRTDDDYWFLTGLLDSKEPTTVDLDQESVDAVRGLAMTVLGDLLEFPGNVPGILGVLPPDRSKARLDKTAAAVSATADILKNVSDVFR